MSERFPSEWSALRVVLCHDWLTGMRGGERVLEILCRAFPAAPIYTLIHKPSAVSETINRHPVIPSRLQSIPGIFEHYRRFLPLFPLAVERFRVPPADLLISTSHCIAKGIRPAPGMRHLCYCFTPMRYAWTFFSEYFGTNPVKAAAVRPLLAALRAWDRRTSARVDRFVAISRHVRDRVRRFYGREADVVFPPVDTARWTPGGGPRGGFDLVVSALVPYKRIDLAVKAYARAGLRLKVAGTGSEERRLRALAGPNVEFLGRVPDDELLGLYRSCRLLVFPGEEDFGLVPLEAQACGTPVVAYGRGGARETIEERVSGLFFAEQTERALLDAVDAAGAAPWDPGRIRARAERFGIPAFVDGLAESIRQCLAGNRSPPAHPA